MKKKCLHIAICCIFITFTFIVCNKIKDINNPLFDITEIKEKITNADIFKYREDQDEDPNKAELDAKDVPLDMTDKIIDMFTIEECDKKLPDKVKIYKEKKGSTYKFLDINNKFDNLFNLLNASDYDYKKIMSDGIDQLVGDDILNNKQSDIDLLETEYNGRGTIFYSSVLKNDKDINNFFKYASGDQKMILAYDYNRMQYGGESRLSELEINTCWFCYQQPYVIDIVSEVPTNITENNVKIVFDNLMKNLNFPYVIKEIILSSEYSRQYYCFKTGNEYINHFVIRFNTKIDEIEVLSCNDKVNGEFQSSSYLNSQGCEYYEDKLSFMQLECYEPKYEGESIDINDDVKKIYDRFCDYILECDKEDEYREFVVEDISIKYIYMNEKYLPVYDVSTVEYVYSEKNKKWEKASTNYLFKIHGIDYTED